MFPGVALCVIQASVLFAEDDSGVKLIFTVPFDHHRMLWGPFNEAGVLGLARSFVFVAAVGLVAGARRVAELSLSVQPVYLCRLAGRGAVAGGKRRAAVPRQSLVGAVHLLLGVLAGIRQRVLQQLRAKAAPRWRLVLCAATLAWHVISGVCFLVMLMRGVSYNVPILTYNLW